MSNYYIDSGPGTAGYEAGWTNIAFQTTAAEVRNGFTQALDTANAARAEIGWPPYRCPVPVPPNTQVGSPHLHNAHPGSPLNLDRRNRGLGPPELGDTPWVQSSISNSSSSTSTQNHSQANNDHASVQDNHVQHLHQPAAFQPPPPAAFQPTYPRHDRYPEPQYGYAAPHQPAPHQQYAQPPQYLYAVPQQQQSPIQRLLHFFCF